MQWVCTPSHCPEMKPSSCYKQILDEVFVISRIIKVKVGVISQSRRLRLSPLPDNPCRGLNYSGYHKPNLIIVLLYIEQNKIEVIFLLLH